MQRNLTQRTLYQTIRKRLTDANLEDAVAEAGFLLESLLEKPLPQLLMDGDLPVAEAIVQRAEQLCDKRCTHYPLQYLLGTWEFYGLSFQVGEGVLIPRADTETLVDFVCSCRQDEPETRLLDLCSGSGCIPSAIAAHLPNVSGMAIERESAAFSYLKKNLQQHAVQVLPVQGDVLQASLAATCTNYHILTCNPPYLTQTDMQQLQPEVAFEPETALYGGTDGLDFYRQVTALWKTTLAAGGWLVYEIGQGQEQDVTDLLQAHGFSHITQRADASGIIRMVAGQR
jgi:release factor glutamine methyltransferase